MLDNKSNLVLLYLSKECGASYKVIEISELSKFFGKDNKIDNEIIKQTISHLDKTGYINVKYSDDELFCVCILPFGRQYLESEQNIKQRESRYKNTVILIYFVIFATSLLGAFLGTLLAIMVG